MSNLTDLIAAIDWKLQTTKLLKPETEAWIDATNEILSLCLKVFSYIEMDSKGAKKEIAKAAKKYPVFTLYFTTLVEKM